MRKFTKTHRARAAQSHRSTTGRLLLLTLLLFAAFGVAKAQQSLPYSYGFENNDLEAEGWTTQNPSGLDGSKFMISNSAKKTGNYGFQFSSYDDNGEHTQYLISPELNAENGVIAQFYYTAYSSYGTEQFKVGYSTTDTEISSFTFGEEISANSTSWAQSEEFVFPAGTKYVAIYYYSDYQYYLYVDDFTFEAVSDCPRPKNLAVYCPGTTATISWTEMGSATEWNLNIDGTVVTTTDNPYTLSGLELNTTHTVKVQAACGSDWSDEVSFTTPPCVGGHVIEYTLNDSYGDGWNGASITFIEGCNQTTLTCSAASASGTLTICGDYFAFIWNKGSYDGECSFTFTENGTTLFTKPSSLTDGQVLYTLGTAPDMLAKPTGLTAGTPDVHSVELSWTAGGDETTWQICINNDESTAIDVNNENSTISEGIVSYTLTGLTPDTDYSVMVRAFINDETQSCWSAPVTFTTAFSCARPENLAEANITYTTADLSWGGSNDSYVVQYGTWTQVGTDHITTATLTPYTFDLSGFSGMGTVAIRHYNVTDMFRMNVDDIVVKDATGETVYSQNFEGGSIPSDMSNIDLDGDGNVWFITSSNINDVYGVTSASWDSNTSEALTPDNWLVISDIQLGGSITFKAIGQDPSAVSENFGVYVIADNQFTDAYSGTNTYCQLTGLTEGTPYVWRVKGMCGEEPSRWVTSMFKTKDDLLVFATDGDWDELSNWTDADGNAATALPTVNNKVRIDAAANIADGVVATAKSAVLNVGSINIEEGGQLKQGSTVKVTMHKGITGFGAGNEAAADYYLIATPHTCSYLEENTTFPYVLNLNDGDYDLYAFDHTAGNEWINFKSNSSHSEFHTGDNFGLFNKKGYLYANTEDKNLTFVGTVSSSLNNTLTESCTYNATSTDAFNGWKLVGNPYTCNAYLMFGDADGDMINATFYKMNAAGDGYDKYEDYVMLAPGEGAFIKYNESGKVYFFSEDQGWTIESSGTEDIPVLPAHGENTNQDANFNALELADDASNNSVLISTAAEAGGTTNVRLTGRTLYKDNEWNTICLPFDVTIDESPLAGATAMKLDDATMEGTHVTLTFVDAEGELEAGKPYIIKWDGDGTNNIVNPVFNGVTISSTEGNTIEKADGNVKFIGYYDAFNITADDDDIYYLTTGNTFKHTGVGRTLNACRAYFEFTEAAAARQFILNFGENSGTTTGIVEVEDGASKATDSTYDLLGRKAPNGQLRKGLYIKDGNKVVIK